MMCFDANRDYEAEFGGVIWIFEVYEAFREFYFSKMHDEDSWVCRYRNDFEFRARIKHSRGLEDFYVLHNLDFPRKNFNSVSNSTKNLTFCG